MKEKLPAYALALVGLVTPAAGLHRFYLGRYGTGILWFLTWGLFGIGTVVDLFTLSRMVEDTNLNLSRGLPPGTKHRALPPPSKEQQILQAAQKNQGMLTVASCALATGLELKEARRRLNQMRDEGFCQRDVNEEGDDLYVFSGLRSLKPFEV